MAVIAIASTVERFTSRLSTLEHLLSVGANHFQADEESYMGKRLSQDMHPLGTQVAFTCNQPHNFCQWTQGASANDLDPKVVSMEQALKYIIQTKAELNDVDADDSLLSSQHRLELGEGLFAELTGDQYLNDFLLPNFYFHLVTAYGIMRMSGVNLGKRDYMLHLMPHVQQSPF